MISFFLLANLENSLYSYAFKYINKNHTVGVDGGQKLTPKITTVVQILIIRILNGFLEHMFPRKIVFER